jgi:hypothetical protein
VSMGRKGGDRILFFDIGVEGVVHVQTVSMSNTAAKRGRLIERRQCIAFVRKHAGPIRNAGVASDRKNSTGARLGGSIVSSVARRAVMAPCCLRRRGIDGSNRMPAFQRHAIELVKLVDQRRRAGRPFVDTRVYSTR